MIKTYDLFDEADLGLLAPLTLSSLESDLRKYFTFGVCRGLSWADTREEVVQYDGRLTF